MLKTLFKSQSEKVIWFPRMKKKKPVLHALSSELRPGCQDDPKQRGGGGLDPNSLLSDIVRGLKRRAQGIATRLLGQSCGRIPCSVEGMTWKGV